MNQSLALWMANSHICRYELSIRPMVDHINY